MELVEGFPPSSQDFNAIENAWDIVKKRLDDTLPRNLDTRAEFIERYRGAIKWVNRNRKDDLWQLSINQKDRASACLATEPPGGAHEVLKYAHDVTRLENELDSSRHA